MFRAAIFNTFLSLIVPVVAFCFDPSLSWARLTKLFWTSFVYANCVGGLFEIFSRRVWNSSMETHPVRSWFLRLGACFLFATVGTLLGTAVVVQFLGVPYWAMFWDAFRFALLITAGATAVITTYETLRLRLDATRLQLKQKELERERATQLATAATLSSLESRIHPHFLFNTINSISSLIHEDPAKAERLLGKLADLLRFSLDAPQVGLVPVAREMKIVGDYLEIEKARLGDRLRFDLDWDPRLDRRVPPLSIQTLVENSIKHAIATRREGGSLSVRVLEAGASSVEVSVQDDGPGFDLAAISQGHGIENLESRLKALFEGHPGLTIRSLEPGCLVSFTV